MTSTSCIHTITMNNMGAEENFTVSVFDENHISQAAIIEKLCFSEPWSEDALSYMCTSPNTYAVAVTENATGRLAAYGGCEYVLDEASIANIATHPDFRRRGCASAVLDSMEGFLRRKGVKDVYLEVRLSNAAAQALYEGRGFRAVGLRRNYYRKPLEDAIVMTKTLD